MAPTSPSKTSEHSPPDPAPLTVWRIVDGKPGHDNQSRGLINAIAHHAAALSFDIPATALRSSLLQFVLRKYPPGQGLSKPDLIIGAGHGTHLSVLCAQRAYGGRSAVIMKPSYPLAWFDSCLIPDHDEPENKQNIIVTQGAINCVSPSTVHDPDRGLILIGGPSRHHGWDHVGLLDQLDQVLKNSQGVTWQIADSRRTPADTSLALWELNSRQATFHSWKETGPEWIPEQLTRAGQAWVSADSISMIYESITAGAATGAFSVPVKKNDKIIQTIERLIQSGMITRFEHWRAGKYLTAPPKILDEADRCARALLILTGHNQHGY